MDIAGAVEQLNRDGTFRQIVNNPMAQFGPTGRNYLGATLLPEVTVNELAYTEQAMRMRSIIANAADRYSPVQYKGGVLTGSMDVRLGDGDIGSMLTGRDYDALIEILERAGQGPVPDDALRRMINWADLTLNVPLLELNEKLRWDAIVDAQVTLTGDNGFSEVVAYVNPSGHRAAAGGAWSNNAYDPYPDIIAMVELLHGKGYVVNRVITGRSVVSKLTNNTNMKQRVGRVVVQPGGTIVGMPGRASIDEINGIFNSDGIPAIEEYNLQYRTSTGTGYFLKRDVMVFICSTGREETLDFGDQQQLVLRDTLGYMAIGRPVGQTTPGRRTVITTKETKPPCVDGQAWETMLPVITENEAIAVITGIT